MATVANLVDEVISMLQGYTRGFDQATHLAATVTAGDLTWTVGDATQLSRGLVEVESELVWVDSVSTSTNQATVAPYGRGFQGTTAASHNQNVRVVFNPQFPRKRVFDAINQTVLACTPDLFSVSTTTFTYTDAVTSYQLPAAAAEVLSVSWAVPGPSSNWQPVSNWAFDKNANTSVFASGRAIFLGDLIMPGRTVQVTYAGDLSEYASEAVQVTSNGLAASAADVLTFGAASRLLMAQDAVRLNPAAVSANALDDKSQVGSSAAVARQLYQMHKQRLGEERMKLLDNVTTYAHYQR